MRRVHCLYCHALILGVQYVPDYPDVFVLYAHKTCHSERTCVDPDATWQMLCEALQLLSNDPQDNDARELVIECLEHLVNWLRKGGVPPKLGGYMDPNAVWKCLSEALKDLQKWPNNVDTRAHVVDCLNVLSRWIYQGGFAPTIEKENK